MFQFAECCVCDSNNSQNEVSVKQSNVTDQEIQWPKNEKELKANEDSRKVTSSPPSAPKQAQPPKDEKDEENRETEKLKLQAMVKAFSKQAIQGLDIKKFRIAAGNDRRIGHQAEWYAPAKFYLDRALSQMSVHGNSKQLAIPLMAVEEVYSFDEITEHFPDKEFAHNLSELDCTCAVYIQHKIHESSGHWLCMIVADEASQERFLTCIQILRLYARRHEQETTI